MKKKKPFQTKRVSINKSENYIFSSSKNNSVFRKAISQNAMLVNKIKLDLQAKQRALKKKNRRIIKTMSGLRLINTRKKWKAKRFMKKFFRQFLHPKIFLSSVQNKKTIMLYNY